MFPLGSLQRRALEAEEVGSGSLLACERKDQRKGESEVKRSEAKRSEGKVKRSEGKVNRSEVKGSAVGEMGLCCAWC